MKKLSYYILIILTLACWACKDEMPTYGPRTEVSFDTDVFVDSRDGKTYHTITIGDQTWMVENLAFRLDSGSWAGCYTYNEITLTPFTDAQIEAIYAAIPKPELFTFEDFLNEVNAAVADGRISDSKVAGASYSPAQIVGYMAGYVNSGYTTSVEQYMYGTSMYGLAFWVNLDPTLNETLMPILEDIVSKLSGPDPLALFLSLIDEAVADGRISNETVDGDSYSAAAIVGYMKNYVNLGYVTSIEQYMTGPGMYGILFWIKMASSLNETLLPLLNEFVAQVESETSEEPWPTPELKAEALANAVKKAQDDAFALTETMNNHYAEKYGLLYTLDAARKAVPEGWRIPTDEDWKKLEMALGMPASECDHLEEWRGGAYLSDWFKAEESGFGLLYGGARIYGYKTGLGTVEYLNKDLNAYYLTDTPMQLNDSTEVVVMRSISIIRDGILRGTSHITAAHNVRLIKDTGTKKEEDATKGKNVSSSDALKE